jgi:8-oxo-dGTP pyrophosphatase MutT (NUDIX family)
LRQRRSARVMLFDPAGRVLLIRCVAMRSDGEFAFWLTPGGEIEAGEEPRAAAVREVREELGLELEVTPAYTEANQFEHQGVMRDNVDYVFTARCEAVDPALRGVTAEEIALMKEIRWWTAEEVETAGNTGAERIFPVDLAVRMRAYGRLRSSSKTT